MPTELPGDGEVFSIAAKERHEAAAEPNGEVNQHLGSFAETKIAAPASHVRSQILYRLLDTNALGSSSDFSDSSLEPVQGLRCDDSLDVWASCKAETEKLP